MHRACMHGFGFVVHTKKRLHQRNQEYKYKYHIYSKKFNVLDFLIHKCLKAQVNVTSYSSMGLENLFSQPFLKIAGIVMEVREVQKLKAALPMYVTESGIVMEAREVQSLKAR